jgi:hypothetical protein
MPLGDCKALCALIEVNSVTTLFTVKLKIRQGWRILSRSPAGGGRDARLNIRILADV